MSKILNAADIIAANDRKRIKVAVPEWGGDVYVAEISAADAESFYAKKDGFKMSGFLAICLVDSNGDRLFTDEEVDALGKKSANVLRRLFDKAQEVNGFGDEGKA